MVNKMTVDEALSDWPPVQLEAGQMLQIRKWSEVFERSDAGRLKTLTWISMPIDFNSTGLQMMFDRFGPERGLTMFGAWSLLVKVAAASPQRGRLGGTQGKPHSTTALSRLMMGAPIDIVDELLSWCVHESKWLEIVDVLHSSENLGESPRSSENLRTTGPNRTGQDITIPTDRKGDDGFVLLSPGECKPVLKRIAKALNITGSVTDRGLLAVYRTSCWLATQGDKRDALLTDICRVLREAQPQKKWQYLFTVCKNRDADPDSFAERWDAVLLKKKATEVSE